MRYDWALTNAEVFRESFVATYAKWCTDNRVKSRAQAYGRGYFLLEGSFPIDIPECETWLKYGIGKDIPEEQYMQYPWHLGQGYTMINKYVSSAAHLKGKKLISSEELTNTDMVFNESLEIFKIPATIVHFRCDTTRFSRVQFLHLMRRFLADQVGRYFMRIIPCGPTSSLW